MVEYLKIINCPQKSQSVGFVVVVEFFVFFDLRDILFELVSLSKCRDQSGDAISRNCNAFALRKMMMILLSKMILSMPEP